MRLSACRSWRVGLVRRMQRRSELIIFLKPAACHKGWAAAKQAAGKVSLASCVLRRLIDVLRPMQPCSQCLLCVPGAAYQAHMRLAPDCATRGNAQDCSTTSKKQCLHVRGSTVWHLWRQLYHSLHRIKSGQQLVSGPLGLRLWSATAVKHRHNNLYFYIHAGHLPRGRHTAWRMRSPQRWTTSAAGVTSREQSRSCKRQCLCLYTL